MNLRVLVVDDEEFGRWAFRHGLRQATDVTIVGEAADGRAAVRAARELQPDVVLMDLLMPELNGTDAIRQLAAESPRIKSLAVSGFPTGDRIYRAFAAGARGFLIKESAPREAVEAIRVVAAGGTYWCSKISDSERAVVRRLLADPASVPPDRLTMREREVLQLICEGNSRWDIARKLFITVHTVESHRKNIMDKLDIRHVGLLTQYAMREGIIK